MRSLFLIAFLCIALPALAADAGETLARDALLGFREPMQQIVAEAAKGDRADLTKIAAEYAEAKAAWLKITSEPLDLDQYDVPEDQQDEVWRQVRKLGLLVNYLDEALARGDRALVLRSAAMLKPPYSAVAAALNVR